MGNCCPSCFSPPNAFVPKGNTTSSVTDDCFDDINHEDDQATVNKIASPPSNKTPSESGRSITGNSFSKDDKSLPVVFEYKTLLTATSKFSPSRVLGEGSFGKVYKGWISPSSTSTIPIPVAVKKLSSDSSQGESEWLQEILMLSRFRHPNLVRLLGYCSEHQQGLLVYEFMAEGSLDYHLFLDKNSSETPLSWNRRLKIALGVATGVAFLHENDVIFRDLKPGNILLDSEFDPKLSDFGFAKAADAYASQCESRVVGDLAYLCPQFLETGVLRKKCDVFSFGVVLLELLTGERAFEKNNRQALHLRYKVLPFLSDKRQIKARLVDPLIRDQFSSNDDKTAIAIASLARVCLQHEAKARPSMVDVVMTLEDILALADRNRRSVSHGKKQPPVV